MKYSFKNVNIASIKAGDTIEHNSNIATVGRDDIKYSRFMGSTLFGDSYRCGHKPVKLINVFKA